VRVQVRRLAVQEHRIHAVEPLHSTIMASAVVLTWLDARLARGTIERLWKLLAHAISHSRIGWWSSEVPMWPTWLRPASRPPRSATSQPLG
jgi:hypothetical protein